MSRAFFPNLMKEVKKDLVDTITGRKDFVKEVKVKVEYRSVLKRILSSLCILPKFKKQEIYLSDPWPGTVFKLLGVLLDLKVSETNHEKDIYAMLQANIPVLIRFIAIGIHNDRSEPPQWLFDALEYQFDNNEIKELSAEVYRRLDVSTFFAITASMVAVNREFGSILEAEAHTP